MFRNFKSEHFVHLFSRDRRERFGLSNIFGSFIYQRDLRIIPVSNSYYVERSFTKTYIENKISESEITFKIEVLLGQPQIRKTKTK